MIISFRRTLAKMLIPLLMLMLAGISVCFIFAGSMLEAVDGVRINEVCSSNFNLMSDENGEYSDYVELYNPSLVKVSLDGLFLSDDGEDLAKYALDGIGLAPGGYTMVWMDGTQSGEVGHASFPLSRKGETLYLSDFRGKILDQVEIPQLTYNTSYGRKEDGGEEWARMSPTAGVSNEGAQLLPAVVLEEPVFSAESGFYGGPFRLTIGAGGGMEIHYTLDGREPTPDSDLYQGGISIEDASLRENVYAARTDLSPTNSHTPSFPVDKATVVRAIAYDPETDRVSRVVTKTYFVGFEEKTEYEGYPVLSLVADPEDLFDLRTGIYGNGARMEEYKAAGGWKEGELLTHFIDSEGEEHYRYMASNAFERGRAWEREAAVSYFDEGHGYCFSQNVGMRISGQSTRASIQKSFNLFGRIIYDEREELPYSFFPGTSYSSIKFRNGGSDNGGSKIMDAFLEQLVSGRDVSIQDARPCVVFLNGEYWGLYNIRERYKEEYVSSHYGVSGGDLWLIDSGDPDIGGDAAREAYEWMMEYLSSIDMSAKENYRAACDLIDMQSLIDFTCANLYVDNTDVAFNRNFAVWRSVRNDGSEYGDGRWRWMLFDMDGALNGYAHNTLAETEEGEGLMDEELIRNLMGSEEFRKRFCLTFLDMANTCFRYETVHESLMEWKERYQVQVAKSHDRFQEEKPGREIFEERIAAFDGFFRERFPYAVSFLAEAFGLTGSLETVTVRVDDPSAGTVRINTVEMGSAGEWSGQYLTDHPITLTASAREGYRFAGWSGDVQGQEEGLEVTIPSGGIRIQARFEPVDEEG